MSQEQEAEAAAAPAAPAPAAAPKPAAATSAGKKGGKAAKKGAAAKQQEEETPAAAAANGDAEGSKPAAGEEEGQGAEGAEAASKEEDEAAKAAAEERRRRAEERAEAEKKLFWRCCGCGNLQRARGADADHPGPLDMDEQATNLFTNATIMLQMKVGDVCRKWVKVGDALQVEVVMCYTWRAAGAGGGWSGAASRALRWARGGRTLCTACRVAQRGPGGDCPWIGLGSCATHVVGTGKAGETSACFV